ncbi:helix-turn-helix domain-containing protein [Mycoplasma sp. OR1901]|uniref:helix-turn-helix domain-containing protein n=1 Tax=Mycoplasma sp. OR1901 TaxID=2742195 RepID=UPI0015837E2D|nr:helix-turn-helix domain-containing protein [Mycoplasma sp. OR1901]QKT05507.1 hypothetical protein HTZ87_02210 [Mycoplasma sp. OR1901]
MNFSIKNGYTTTDKPYGLYEKYNQISKEERFFIQKSIENDYSLRSVARKLKINVLSISKEFKKCKYYGSYDF